MPADVFTSLWRRYESAKQRADRIDFEDMLTLAVELYETDADALALVHRRYSWFSVDEYQDTNRLQEDLLRLWLGDRQDLCVVGDPDQTIYTFTGASSDYLTSFKDRYADARVVRLSANYRSTPQVIALANRLIPGRELRSTAADGPIPEMLPHADGDAEVAAVVARIRAMLADGVAVTEFAILVRTNAQLVPFEAALTAAEIPFTVRGVRFFERRDVRTARAALRGLGEGRLSHVVAEAWRKELGFDEGDPPGPASGAEARDRHAALSTLLGLARALEADQPSATVADFLADLARRDADEADAGGDGVTLSTLHRAKGLEWDAVFLPGLEEGTLPIRQSASDPDTLAEERRLLYVGITRARRHLVLSWAGSRLGAKGPVRARSLPGSSPSCGRTPSPVRRRSRRRHRPSSCPRTTSLSSSASSSGAGSAPAPTACRRTSWPTTRHSPPSRCAAHRMEWRCWPCPASVSARSPVTATKSSTSSGPRRSAPPHLAQAGDLRPRARRLRPPGSSARQEYRAGPSGSCPGARPLPGREDIAPARPPPAGHRRLAGPGRRSR